MSESMIERVAGAIRHQYFADAMQYQGGNIFADNWEALARAAIEAMREPTPRMLSAGKMYERTDLADQWRDMIDEALAEKT